VLQVRFVIASNNPNGAVQVQGKLGEKAELDIKNRVEEFGLAVIGDTLKVETPEDFKSSAASGVILPSQQLAGVGPMDSTGGMNAGLAAAGATGAGMGAGVGGGMGAGVGGGMGAAGGLGGLPGAGERGLEGGTEWAVPVEASERPPTLSDWSVCCTYVCDGR
jgi:hypothetical protein